jgi:hypothetical protein
MQEVAMDADIVIAVVLIVGVIVAVAVAVKRGDSISCANCPDRRNPDSSHTTATLGTSTRQR